MSVPERGGRCFAAPASPDPVVKAEREAAWHGRQKAENGPGGGARALGGREGERRPPPGPTAAPAGRGRSGERGRWPCLPRRGRTLPDTALDTARHRPGRTLTSTAPDPAQRLHSAGPCPVPAPARCLPPAGPCPVPAPARPDPAQRLHPAGPCPVPAPGRTVPGAAPRCSRERSGSP